MLKLISGSAASMRALHVAVVAALSSANVYAAQDEPPASLPAPFERYQKWADVPVTDWRAANARVGEVGGWRSYLRESPPPGEASAGDGDDAEERVGPSGHDAH